MTLFDHLRTAELLPAQSTRSGYRSSHVPTSRLKTSNEFDQNERHLKKATIDTLRFFCQTKQARKGFEAFERHIYAKDPDFGKQHQGIVNMHRNKNSVAVPSSLPPLRSGFRSPYPSNPAKTRAQNIGSKISDGLSQSMFRKSTNDMIISKLTKSITTSNITSCQPYGSYSTSTSASGFPEDPQKQLKDSAKASQLDILEAQVRAVQQREVKASARATNKQRRVSNRIFPETSATSAQSSTELNQRASKPLAENVSGNKLNLPPLEDVSSVVKGKKPEVLCYERGLSIYSDRTLSGALPTTPGPGTSGETGGKSGGEERSEGKRRFRKSDSMKRFFDSGIREVRKISRRVGNSISDEDDDF